MLCDTESILISCAGLGMGNASRVVAVVESLLEKARQDGRQLRIHIVSWGAGLTFLKEYKEESGCDFQLTEGHAYTRLAGFPAAYARNVRLLRRLTAQIRPDLILLDSDYHFPAYWRSGCPVVFVGQANDVVERARLYPLRSMRERVNFHLKEHLDSLLQNLFSTMVLVPCFNQKGAGARKIKRIPLIVRKEFLQTPADSPARASVGLLLSGSELEKKVFVDFANKHGLTVLTPDQTAVVPTVPSHAALIDQFDVVFTQGGLSSISECIARSKFLVVFPIQEHPEQILNAREVEKLGLGLRSSIDELNRFPHLLAKIKRTRNRKRAAAGIGCNGADVAAGLIYQKMSESKLDGKLLGRKREELVEGLHA